LGATFSDSGTPPGITLSRSDWRGYLLTLVAIGVLVGLLIRVTVFGWE
jgi:hypothetical protein